MHGKFIVRIFGVNDNPKENKLFGTDLDKIAKNLGVKLWEDDSHTLWSAALYPEKDTIEEAVGAALNLYAIVNGDASADLSAWKETPKKSLCSGFNDADPDAIIAWNKRISNFGIGFLSSFMVCREIDVKTKYYIENSEGLKLHIPNYDGCFFIELDKNTNIGTEIKLYMNSDINDKGIVDYIQNVMQDIKYAINIRYLNEKEEEKQKHIPAHAVRRRHESEEFKFFVPFSENGDVGMANYENEIRNNAYIDKYEYGILICRKKNLNTVNEDMILNSGIIVERASLSEIFGENMRISKYIFNSYERERAYNDIIVNFPSNWLQLDVARDNITDFSDIINDNGGADLLIIL